MPAAAVGVLFSVNDAYPGPLSRFSGGIDGAFVVSGVMALVGCPVVERLWPIAKMYMVQNPRVVGPGLGGF